MLMLHGSGTPPKPQVAAPDPDVDADDDDDVRDADRFEDALFALLVQLEHLRETLAEAEPARVPPLVGELMKRVSAFANENCPLGPGPEGMEAQTRLAEFQSAWKALKDQADDPGAARRCFAALYDAVFAHFVVFTSRFPTSRSAHGWVEVAATFVTDLKRTHRDPDTQP
ncbi:MAG TPA: hypothetical protein VKD90_23370 [Gemmataceae bacterium]|nr:hypothetical protein [Gemmataceae bacterium]